jgi:hypothetical protein
MAQPISSQKINLKRYLLIISVLLAPIISLFLPLNISVIIKLAIGYASVGLGYISGYIIVKVVTSSVAKPTETPVAKPTETPVAKPTETPVAKPTETPVEKPTEDPIMLPSIKETGRVLISLNWYPECH